MFSGSHGRQYFGIFQPSVVILRISNFTTWDIYPSRPKSNYSSNPSSSRLDPYDLLLVAGSVWPPSPPAPSHLGPSLLLQRPRVRSVRASAGQLPYHHVPPLPPQPQWFSMGKKHTKCWHANGGYFPQFLLWFESSWFLVFSPVGPQVPRFSIQSFSSCSNFSSL